MKGMKEMGKEGNSQRDRWEKWESAWAIMGARIRETLHHFSFYLLHFP
jgi:hypothetical protein